MSSEPQDQPRFDIAVSFAGEDRAFVEEVVRGVDGDRRVFYDEDFMVEVWGQDLVEYFTNLYSGGARFVVIFISAKYAEKSWTSLERRSALAGALARRDPYVLPVRMDDTPLPGLLPTTGYLDARRLGARGVSEAINSKLGSTKVQPLTPSPVLDGRVPRSAEGVQELIARKPTAWEYKLYASLLMANLAAMEDRYRDHAMAYAPPSGFHVDATNLNGVVQIAVSRVLVIIANLTAVLDLRAQEVAFGPPGQPGNVEAIEHLAQRFASVYGDLLQWSRDLRGMSARGENVINAVRTLARAADSPVEAVRQFVRDFVAEVDTVEARIKTGQRVSIELTLELDMDPQVMRQFRGHVRRAIKRGR